MSNEKRSAKSPVESVKKVWQHRRRRNSMLVAEPVALLVPSVKLPSGGSEKLEHLTSIYH